MVGVWGRRSLPQHEDTSGPDVMKIHPSHTLLKQSSNIELKPFTFPTDFIVVIDTREKLPLFGSLDLKVEHKKLNNGDYSLKGFEDKIFVERKQVSDLVAYIGKDHKKTEGKLSRLQGYEWKALTIETSEEEVLSQKFFSNLSVESIRQSLALWEVKYGLNVYYSSNRGSIERWILDRMIWFYTIKRNG